MASGLTQNGNHQIGGAIHHFGLVGEFGSRIDETDEFHKAFDFGKVAVHGRIGLRQQRQRAGLCCGGTGFDIQICAELAADQPIRTVGNLAGDEQLRSAFDKGDIIRGRRRGVGQGEIEVGKFRGAYR